MLKNFLSYIHTRYFILHECNLYTMKSQLHEQILNRASNVIVYRKKNIVNEKEKERFKVIQTQRQKWKQDKKKKCLKKSHARVRIHTHTYRVSRCVDSKRKKNRINVFLSLRSCLLHFVSVAFFSLSLGFVDFFFPLWSMFFYGTVWLWYRLYVCCYGRFIYHILQVEKFSIWTWVCVFQFRRAWVRVRVVFQSTSKKCTWVWLNTRIYRTFHIFMDKIFLFSQFVVVLWTLHSI